ncbi:hypothetical protein [Psychrobacter sp. AOP3-A1-26]|uniref:hypothetical protein n=1 Tax=Psychrobacter sp. AOP3-A1-26 TaxID=3457700 RepID=UPI00264C227F|nr:hypothetical protein [Psychrobacter sp.]MDN5890962.1 hypothetical protein [Psychrobacter sp.]
MGAKKILSYGRFVVVMLLVAYLILVWMYFKDNARQLTSSGLLLWFVAIPLLFVGVIMMLLWWQKRLNSQEREALDSTGAKSDKKAPVKLPDTYQLFIYSRVCLPEGDSWSDVVDNDEDLTVLSEDLMDMDGLPILTKPIARLTDAASLPYAYLYDDSLADSDFDDNEDTHTEHMPALNDVTLRLCSLVYEQLASSDEILYILAEHFHQYHKNNNTQPNSAIDVHPEWQQHYLASASEENSQPDNESANDSSNDDTLSVSAGTSLAKLPIYLCLPASADSALLIAAIKEQLATYGIPEALLSIEVIPTDDVTIKNNVEDSIEDNVELDGSHGIHGPSKFINRYLIPLSQSSAPELCLMLIADSQINEEWLDAHMYSNSAFNVIPTEAGALLVFSNQAAQDVLNIDSSASILLTEICAPSPKDSDVKNNNKRSYFQHLTAIKNLLINNNLSLSPTDTTALKTTDKPTTKPKKESSDIKDKTNNKTNVSLADMSITTISDINPLKQPYDLSTYMNFLEAFIAKGALVNEHHLGHYMPLNNWLSPFISLSLFVNMVEKNQQESDEIFLVTQHKHCSMLWLADFSQTPES